MSDSKPLTFLCMPGYGNQSAAAGRALWRARRDMSTVRVAQGNSSLLASNFNTLWASALNEKVNGTDIRHFAMIHDDIGACDYWLDMLLEEMESNDLDVLGVVSPIKGPQGLTSIALDDPDTQWHPKCRLTMHEVFRLPETFTASDTGHPLLFNTGLWVCRFGDWAGKVHFTINDRLWFDEVENMYKVGVESEDWYFSRRCNELGLKIGCTRKVRVDHKGSFNFPNWCPWGTQKHDQSLIEESVIPDLSPDGFRFPHGVDGWLLEEEGRALAELARGKNVLEIGSYCGRSTICIAQTAKHVTSVDTWDGAGTPKPISTRDQFDQNIRQAGVFDKVLAQTSVPHCWKYDLAFIDGAHDAESVRADIGRSLRVLKDDGLLAFHDYRTVPGEHDGRWDPDVTAVVDEFIASGAEIVDRHKTLAVVRPPEVLAV